jgi:cell division protein FtsL
MAGAQRKFSHMEIIMGFTIILLKSEFLLLVLSFIVNNMGKFQTNSDIHDISTRHITYLYTKHIDVLGTNFG